MNVTKVKLAINQALFNKCYFKGKVFYITNPHRDFGSTIDFSKVFDESGELLGKIKGHYFDFGNKKVFEVIE